MFFFKISVEEKLLQLSPTNLTRYSPMLNSYIWSITTCIVHLLAIGYKSMYCKHCKGLFADQVKFDMSVLHRVRYMFQVYTKILGILPKNFIWSNTLISEFVAIVPMVVFSRVCARHQGPIDLSLGIFDRHFQHTNWNTTKKSENSL